MAKYKVTAARLNVKKATKKDSEVLRIVEKDTILEATSVKNGWVRLKGTGYVMAEFTEEIAE